MSQELHNQIEESQVEANILHQVATLCLVAFEDAAKASTRLHPNDNIVYKIVKCPDIAAYGATMILGSTVFFLLGSIFNPVLPKKTFQKKD